MVDDRPLNEDQIEPDPDPALPPAKPGEIGAPYYSDNSAKERADAKESQTKEEEKLVKTDPQAITRPPSNLTSSALNNNVPGLGVSAPAEAPGMATPQGPSGMTLQKNPDGTSTYVPAQPTTLAGINREKELALTKANEPVKSAWEQALDKQKVAAATAQEVATQSSVLDQQKAADAVARQNLETQAQTIAQNNISQRIAARNAEIAKIPDVDPDRRSIPAKILGAIAMGLGAYGAGITHSQNFAMNIINDSIANDVKAQQANINKKWQAVNEHYKLDNDLALRDKFVLQQHRDAKTFMWQQYDDAQKSLAAKSGNAQTQAASAAMSAKIQDQISGIDKESLSMQAGDRMTELQQRTAQAAAGQAHSQRLADKIEEAKKDRFDKVLAAGGTPAQAELESQRAGNEVAGVENSARDTSNSSFVPKEQQKLMAEDLNGNKRPVQNEPALTNYQKTLPNYYEAKAAVHRVEEAGNDPIARARASVSLNRAMSRLEGRGRIDPQTGIFVPDETPGPFSLEKGKGLDQAKQHIEDLGKAAEKAAFGTYQGPTGTKKVS